MLNSANIATIQSNRIPLYGSVLNHIETYFQLIKDNYGQSFYDQLWSHFSNTGSYYADSLKVMEWHIYGSSRIGICHSGALVSVINGNDLDQNGELSADEYISSSLQTISYNYTSYSYYRGLKNYELTNHLGNVLVVVSDRKINQCNSGVFVKASAVVVSATDYSPFGAPLAGRTFQSSEYRFSFNGQEKDDEIAGAGNIMTAEFWEYDARLGRRWNVDPINRPMISNYSAFSNSPITRIDPNGKSDYYTANGRYLGSDGTKGTDIMVITDKSIIKKIDKLSYETLKDNTDPYIVVNVSLAEDSYFKLPSYEERRNIEKEINKVDYSDGNYYEIGGSKSNEGVVTLNEGNKMNVQEIGKKVDEYKGNGTPTTLTVDVGGWAGAEYTWHLHPDKTFIEKTTTGKWQLLSSEPGVKTISGSTQYFGGYELSDLDMNLTHSKNNFLITKSGKDVIRFNNTSSSNTSMDRSFFFNTKAKEVPNKK